MSRRVCFVSVIFLSVCVAGSGFGIDRVAPQYNLMEFYGGYANPVGSYEGTLLQDFTAMGRVFSIDADAIYEPGFCVGLNYGRLYGGHWQSGVGLRYTRLEFEDVIRGEDDRYIVLFTLPETPTLTQWDLDFNLNYQFFDLKYAMGSPYFGVGLHPGISTAHFEEFANENQFNFAAGFNFGADIKLWSGPSDQTFVTLSSINSWNLVSTSDRPRQLTLGAGIKYFFKD